MQNRGSDAYSVRKKTGLGLNTSQTKHDTNDHGTYASYVKGKHTSFAKKFISLNRLM